MWEVQKKEREFSDDDEEPDNAPDKALDLKCSSAKETKLRLWKK